MRVRVEGGDPQHVCDVPGQLRGASWATDDTVIFGTQLVGMLRGTGLWQCAPGGNPTSLTTPEFEKGEVDHRWPEILPGGEAVLFTVIADRIEDSQIAVLTLDTREWTTLVRGSHPRYSPTGHLIYAVGSALWAVPFNLKGLETVGDSVRVLEGVLTKSSGAADFDLSDTGTLVFLPSSKGRRLVYVNEEGLELPVRMDNIFSFLAPRVSPDQRHIAFVGREDENADLWTVDPLTGITERLTNGFNLSGHHIWTRDGTRIIFASRDEAEVHNIYSVQANKTADPVPLLMGARRDYPTSIAPNGDIIIHRVFGVGRGHREVWKTNADGGEEVALVPGESLRGNGQISPDGNWLAYESDETDRMEVWVRPYPVGSGEPRRISLDGGYRPMWAVDGSSRLFYRNGVQMIAVTFVSGVPPIPESSPVLFEESYYTFTARGWPGGERQYDVMKDGRFVMIKDADVDTLDLTLNWTDELQRIVPSP